MTNSDKSTLLVLGGSSAIALAFVEKTIFEKQKSNITLRVILVGRNSKKLNADAADLTVKGATVDVVVCNLNNIKNWVKIREMAQTIDVAFIGYGQLTDQSKAATDNIYLQQQLSVNFTSVTGWLERISDKFEQQGYGQAIVVGSVAGDRGRQSNYSYGAAKAGLATYVSGLQHRFGGRDKINILLVKPGFVETPMTAHITPKGILWAKPDEVASLIFDAVKKRKKVAYVPKYWWLIMTIITNIPNFIFHRTKL